MPSGEGCISALFQMHFTGELGQLALVLDSTLQLI